MVNFILIYFFSILEKSSSANSKYLFCGKISFADINALIIKQFKSNWIYRRKKVFFFQSNF